MRKALFAGLLALFALGCATVPPGEAPGTAGLDPSACTDSLYLALKAKPLDDMTEREYAYYTQKDKDCGEYQKAQMQAKPYQDMAKNTDKYLIFIGVVTLLSTLVILAL